MKFLWCVIFSCIYIFALCSNISASDLYKVEVTKVANNLYKTAEGVIIKTRFCYEYALSEKAILQYDGPYSFDNKLIFLDTRTTCDVEAIVR